MPLLRVPFKPTFAVKQMTTDEGCGPSRHNDRSKNKTIKKHSPPIESRVDQISLLSSLVSVLAVYLLLEKKLFSLKSVQTFCII